MPLTNPAQVRIQRFSLQLFIEQLLGGVLGMLGDLGDALIMERPEPLDLPDATPFPDDFHHHDYDPFWISRYWRILSEVNLILEELAGEFSGKTSPVHHFWHTMDIAVTRFSDREVFHPASVDSVTREAYSREVISSGFWFGDVHFSEPAFYSYTAPEPPGLASTALRPHQAEWLDRATSHLAVYRYDDARGTQDPRSSASVGTSRSSASTTLLRGSWVTVPRSSLGHSPRQLRPVPARDNPAATSGRPPTDCA